MEYKETLEWMFAQLPMYQRQGETAFKKDLTNSIEFASYLGDPHQKIKTIHVGGTNGKGSTSHMIASMLQEAGYKVGLYTSPHLKSFTERIRINGSAISEETVTTFINEHKAFLETQSLSFFEMTVGMAFWYFSNQKVDIAIIEVGLGGRLDSTNIILPEVSVITNIGLDHTLFLGETLPEIAREKAGVIKVGTPLVVGERQDEIADIFVGSAKALNACITFASDNTTVYQTDLLGVYQKNNVKTAVTAIKKLKGFKVSQENIKKGLLSVVKNTSLKGRWQVLKAENPKVICDTAHNKEGLKYVLEQLANEVTKELHIVLGVVSDKKLEDILPMFPEKAKYYFCRPNIPRGLSEVLLSEKAAEFGLRGAVFGSVNQAFSEALANSGDCDVVFVGGSTFVVAEII